jgi:hypothetical protein
LHLPFRFEIEFFLLFIYPRLDLRPSVALIPLIDYTDLLGADLAGYKTVTVCMYKCDACVHREMGEGNVPSLTGALLEPLAM